jgi:hypothetical protein
MIDRAAGCGAPAEILEAVRRGRGRSCRCRRAGAAAQVAARNGVTTAA